MSVQSYTLDGPERDSPRQRPKALDALRERVGGWGDRITLSKQLTRNFTREGANHRPGYATPASRSEVASAEPCADADAQFRRITLGTERLSQLSHRAR